MQSLLREANFDCQHKTVWFLTDTIITNKGNYRLIHYGSHHVGSIVVELSRSDNFNNFSGVEEIIRGKLDDDSIFNQVIGFLKQIIRTNKLEEFK